MKKKTEPEYSFFIKSSSIKKKSNKFFSKILKILFHKIEFDNESLTYLKEYTDKGLCVFTSFQCSQTSLLIFLNQLKKNGYKTPVLGLGFNPYFLQIVLNFFSKTAIALKGIFRKKDREKLSIFDSMKIHLNEGPIILSLLSEKTFFKRYIEIQTDFIQHLIEIQKSTDKPVYIFPEIMFWNMNPERTKNFMALNSTRDRGLISALIAVKRSVTPGFIRISKPINLKEEIVKSSTDDSRHISQLIRNRLLEIYNHEKRTTLGPVIKSRNEMKDKILFHDNVLNTINELVAEGKISEKKLRKKAYGYYREIAADFSIFVINFFERSLRFVYRKIFDGIHCDLENFKKIREASLKGPLVIVPCHKSHMDYLIISCLFFNNKVVPPHIVAGSNLTFFPMGTLFRKSGAFFMRRSFKGEKLYSVVFKQYIKTLVNEGYSIEFFIEGGRTRSGKLVSPKMGVLKYLVETIDEGYNRDLMFVPLSINYDRILEESSYDKESKGKGKKKETTSALVKSRQLLKRKYGKVYVEFNEPFSLNEFRKKHADVNEITPLLGNHIVKKINEVIMVTPFAFTTTAILFSPNRGFTRAMLKDKMDILYDYLNFIDAPLSDALKNKSNYFEIIDFVIKPFIEDRIIQTDNKDDKDYNDDEKIFTANPEYRGRINFYRNSILHFFIPISLVSIAISNFESDGIISLKKIKNEFISLMDFFSKEFIYPEFLEDVDRAIHRLLDYLVKRSVIFKNGKNIRINEEKISELRFHAEMVQDYYESYNIVIDTIKNIGNKKMNKKDLMQEIRKNGASMFKEGKVRLMESLSISNYNNALLLLSDKEVLTEDSSDEKSKNVIINDSQKADSIMKSISDYMSKIK